MDRFEGRRIRFGITGCGVIGPTHAGALQKMNDVELVAVADIIPERAKSMAEKFNVPRVYTDHAALLRDPNVDVVCICTPSGMHGDGAVAAMQAGKHVVVEKPMEVTVAACNGMIAAQQATGKLMTVICQHRFDSVSRQVKELIDSQKLGRIILATAEVKWWRTQQYYDSGDWRGTWAHDGGGAVMNQGIHTIDLLQWFAGGVDSIFAQTRTAAHERIEVEDTAVASLNFRNGAIGSYVASTAAYDGMPVRIDLIGTEGSVVLEGDRLKSLKLKSGEEYQTGQPAAHAMRVASGGTASVANDARNRKELIEEGAVWGDAHRAQLTDFVSALRSGGKPLIDGPAGRDSVEIICALYQSAKSGCPVKLR